MATSPGLLVSIISREGAFGLPDPRSALVSSMNSRGTRMVLSLLENPATWPVNRLVRVPSSLVSVRDRGMLDMSPSESWGSPAEEANPKL